MAQITTFKTGRISTIGILLVFADFGHKGWWRANCDQLRTDEAIVVQELSNVQRGHLVVTHVVHEPIAQLSAEAAVTMHEVSIVGIDLGHVTSASEHDNRQQGQKCHQQTSALAIT